MERGYSERQHKNRIAVHWRSIMTCAFLDARDIYLEPWGVGIFRKDKKLLFMVEMLPIFVEEIL